MDKLNDLSDKVQILRAEPQGQSLFKCLTGVPSMQWLVPTEGGSGKDNRQPYHGHPTLTDEHGERRPSLSNLIPLESC